MFAKNRVAKAVEGKDGRQCTFFTEHPSGTFQNFASGLFGEGDKKNLFRQNPVFDHSYHTCNQTVSLAGTRYRDDCHRAIHVFNNSPLLRCQSFL